jgi:hypothetical protein
MATAHEWRPTEGQSRSFVDEQGVSWRVFQRHVEGEEDCLIFESESAYRRVRGYPADWRALSSEELSRLSWKR